MKQLEINDIVMRKRTHLVNEFKMYPNALFKIIGIPVFERGFTRQIRILVLDENLRNHFATTYDYDKFEIASVHTPQTIVADIDFDKLTYTELMTIEMAVEEQWEKRSRVN